MSKALKLRQGTAISSEEKIQFLDTLRDTFNVSKAASAISRHRSSLYKLRQSDEDFAAAWDEVIEECLDELEGVVYQRALEGKQALYPIFVLKHRRPNRWGDRLKVEADQRVNIVVDLVPFDSDSAEKLPTIDVEAEVVSSGG